MNNLLLTNYGAIIDVVALVIVFGFALVGLKKGFVKSLISTFGTVLSLLFAVLLCTRVADVLESKFSFVSKLSNSIANFLDRLVGEDIMNTPLSHASDDIFGSAGIGGIIASVILSVKNDTSIPLNTSIRDVLAPTFSYYVIIAISVVILYILFKIALFLIGEIIKRNLYKINSVAKTDKLLGFIFGLISGIVYIEFFILIISILPLGFCQNLYVQIHATTFTAFIEKINLYSKLINMLSIGSVIEHIKSILIL